VGEDWRCEGQGCVGIDCEPCKAVHCSPNSKQLFRCLLLAAATATGCYCCKQSPPPTAPTHTQHPPTNTPAAAAPTPAARPHACGARAWTATRGRSTLTPTRGRRTCGGWGACARACVHACVVVGGSCMRWFCFSEKRLLARPSSLGLRRQKLMFEASLLLI